MAKIVLSLARGTKVACIEQSESSLQKLFQACSPFSSYSTCSLLSVQLTNCECRRSTWEPTLRPLWLSPNPSSPSWSPLSRKSFTKPRFFLTPAHPQWSEGVYYGCQRAVAISHNELIDLHALLREIPADKVGEPSADDWHHVLPIDSSRMRVCRNSLQRLTPMARCPSCLISLDLFPHGSPMIATSSSPSVDSARVTCPKL